MVNFCLIFCFFLLFKESQIQNFGQTPQLLLNDPHPCRFQPEKCWSPLISESSFWRNLEYHTPKKQFGGDNTKSHGKVLSIHVLPEQIVAVYSDLSIGTYRWSYTESNPPFIFKRDKLRKLGCNAMSICPSVVNPSLEENGFDSSIFDSKIDWFKSGILEPGNCTFATTLSGLFKYQTKRYSLGTQKAKDFKISDASFILLSCSYIDGTVKAHSLDGLQLRGSERGTHRGPINCLCVGDDDELMITGGVDATCRVWVVDHTDMGIALKDGYIQTALGKSQNVQNDSILMCCHILWVSGFSVTFNCFLIISY